MAATPAVVTATTVEVALAATRTGEVDEKTETGRHGGGGIVVALPTGTETAPSPGSAQAVLDAYCEVMAEAGAPVVKARTLLAGIHDALRAGYSPGMVLVGLGMWECEGFRSPRQIEEWIEKAARQGGGPQGQMTAPALLVEGRERY